MPPSVRPGEDRLIPGRELPQPLLVVLADPTRRAGVGAGPDHGDEVRQGREILLAVRDEGPELRKRVHGGGEEDPGGGVLPAGEPLPHGDEARLEPELVVHEEARSITDRRHAAVVAMGQALEETWDKRPLYRREGGSIPVVASMQKILGIELVLTGFSLPEDNLHAPNEKLHIPTFKRGIAALVRFL